MKNFEVTSVENGNKYWISRAMAVCAIVIVYDDGIPHLLINKRGPGTPDYQGCWNIPCGYLDWDETTSEACTREILEECKVYINPSKWVQYGEIEDSINSNRQNVTIRKIVKLEWNEWCNALKDAISMNTDGGEENEVDDIKLLPLSAYNIMNTNWAFNHKQLAYDIMTY